MITNSIPISLIKMADPIWQTFMEENLRYCLNLTLSDFRGRWFWFHTYFREKKVVRKTIWWDFGQVFFFLDYYAAEGKKYMEVLKTKLSKIKLKELQVTISAMRKIEKDEILVELAALSDSKHKIGNKLCVVKGDSQVVRNLSR